MGEGSKEESVLYKVTYCRHLESIAFHSQNGGYLLRGKFTIVCLTEAHNRENTKFICFSGVSCFFMVGKFLEK